MNGTQRGRTSRGSAPSSRSSILSSRVACAFGYLDGFRRGALQFRCCGSPRPRRAPPIQGQGARRLRVRHSQSNEPLNAVAKLEVSSLDRVGLV
jgi:hypothetical protein